MNAVEVKVSTEEMRATSNVSEDNRKIRHSEEILTLLKKTSILEIEFCTLRLVRIVIGKDRHMHRQFSCR